MGGYTYTINDGSTYGDNVAAFGVASGSTVTFQNGTLNKRVTGDNSRDDRTIAINATGNVVLNGVTLDRTVTSSAGTVTVTGSSSVPGGATTYILENGVSFVASASITLTTTADKTASIVASSGRTITATESDSTTVAYRAIGSAVTFTYDADRNASVTNLSSGKSFSIVKNNGETVTYTMSAGGLRAVQGNATKIWEGGSIDTNTSIAASDLDFDSATNLTAAILTSSNVPTISDSAALRALNAGDVLKVIDNTDYTKSFGYLTKIDDNTYSLTKDSSNNKILSGIVINNDLTVQFDRNFQSVPITVTGSASGTTSLQAASANAFTLSNSNTGVASVEGAVQVSLVGGSLKTANAQTTIRAGSYTANYATTTGDGVNIIATSKATQISGIDSGEAFSVSGSRYYRDDTGLRTGSSGVFTSDIATISNNDNSLSIDLAKLKSSVGSFIQPDNKGVLEFGKTNTGYAVVVNDTSSPTVKYAELLVDSSSTLGNAYTLRPSADSNTDGFLGAVNTVSLTGGRGTTIYKALVDDKVIAATSGSRPDATFKVSTSNDTFTVTLKTTSAETKISTDATGITLLSGTLQAAAGQTITLGEGGRQFYVSSSSNGMNVTFDGSTATITGAKNDTFTIDGTQYSVGNASDGMTFTVTDNNVIVSDFATSDSDAFTYGGRTYSVQGAGFLMTQSGKHSLWSDGNNNHSLTGGTVTIESLFTNDHTWDAVETVDAANAAATLPPSDNDATVTLIGDDFEDTFGVFIKQGTAVTVTTGSADDEATLKKVLVNSGVKHFNFNAFQSGLNVTADAPNLTINGGAGNDTINLNSNVLIKYASGGGFDTILGFNEDDTLQIGNGTYSAETVGSDIIVTVGDGSVALKGAASLTELNIFGRADTTSGGDTATGNGKILINMNADSLVAGTAYNDAIYNCADNVKVSGGKGDDILTTYPNTSNVSLTGGDGNDILENRHGSNVVLEGGAGNDYIYNDGEGALIKYASGDGNDFVYGFNATSTLQIDDGKGVYSSVASGSDVVLTVGKGKITLAGAATLMTLNIDGSAGVNVTAAKTTLASGIVVGDATARTAATRIVGNALANSILGGNGKDTLYGGAGADYLSGNAGNDKLYGQAGNDYLEGGAGNDYLSSSGGKDTLRGGAGNDTLWGGAGNDTLTGGDGNDTFIYKSGEGKDVITDFGDDDLLQITGTFSATYNESKNSIAFKVGSTASALTLKNFTASTFNINGDAYAISGTKLVKRN